MQFRILEIRDDQLEYKLLSYFNVDDYYEMYRLFRYMANHSEDYDDLMINIHDMVDTDGIFYYVESVCFVAPTISGETGAYFAVYVKEC